MVLYLVKRFLLVGSEEVSQALFLLPWNGNAHLAKVFQRFLFSRKLLLLGELEAAFRLSCFLSHD